MHDLRTANVEEEATFFGIFTVVLRIPSTHMLKNAKKSNNCQNNVRSRPQSSFPTLTYN